LRLNNEPGSGGARSTDQQINGSTVDQQHIPEKQMIFLFFSNISLLRVAIMLVLGTAKSECEVEGGVIAIGILTVREAKMLLRYM
jgi:hypothetical protein